MRYLMLVMSTPEDPDLRPEDAAGAPPIEAWVERHYGSGAAVLGDRLRPPQDAVGVRVRGGRALVTDGPFSETKETIAGFDVLDAPDLDTAIAIAAEHPMAYEGAIELRPFWPLGLDDAPDGAVAAADAHADGGA
ncbi:YciI family protein [Isoptericola cucumis]|uniref:Transcription initiation protein n=1 Tax=Isoptericola cucumis TaxID=1776856 RepID=A0ABQ2B761_9MICO|nr:YciI family protein [Isoptericola cucumis]GGI09697.1 transcription initiation protein [Isoptericola cucumis]